MTLAACLRHMRPAFVAAALAGPMFAMPASAQAIAAAPASPITWRMATSWPAQLPLLNEAAVDFADSVRRLSGGRMAIEVVDPSKHGAPAGLLQAVKEGQFEMAHTTAHYYAKQVPAIDYFTAVPFGFTGLEAWAWMNEGGGQALFEAALAPHGILPLTVGMSGVQMAGWFAKPVASVADLKGLRVRIEGFPGRVLARLGAVPVSMPLGQIVKAFADGTIDGADTVVPAIDAALPLAQYAPYYYGPWHEPDAAMHVFISRARFDALPADLQQIVRQATQAAALRMMARNLDRNAQAMRLIESRGTRVVPLPPAVLQALREATAAELADVARTDAVSRPVIESLLAYKARVQPYALQTEALVLQGRAPTERTSP